MLTSVQVLQGTEQTMPFFFFEELVDILNLSLKPWPSNLSTPYFSNLEQKYCFSWGAFGEIYQCCIDGKTTYPLILLNAFLSNSIVGAVFTVTDGRTAVSG